MSSLELSERNERLRHLALLVFAAIAAVLWLRMSVVADPSAPSANPHLTDSR